MVEQESDSPDSGWELLQARLDEAHVFPCSYTFKFIAPRDGVDLLVDLLRDHQIERRDSARGRWVSVTVAVEVASSDEVLAIYRSVQHIEGLISL